MPELVKLNRTEVHPRGARSGGCQPTQASMPFIVAQACKAELEAIEHLGHSRLAWSRKDKGEFFRCEVATAVRTTQAFHVPSDALCDACDG